MKAIRVHQRGGLEAMNMEDMERPTPTSEQVLIKVAVAGVNFADLGQRNGRYQNLAPLPLTLGFEVAGTIEEVGADVTTLNKGTRVVALVDGGYAEYAVANANVTVPLPEQVSFAEAVVLPVQGQTAYLALEKTAHLRKGERILIHSAAGGLGSLLVQLAKLMGASTVIGTTTSTNKEDFIHSLGADAVIHIDEENWVKRVMEATQGQGVDVAIETIGGNIGQQTIACLALNGRMVICGSLSGEPTPIVTQMLIPKCLSVVGYNTNVQSLDDQMRATHALLDYIANKQLKVVLDDSFPLEKARDAHQAIQEKKTHGKVVLTIA